MASPGPHATGILFDGYLFVGVHVQLGVAKGRGVARWLARAGITEAKGDSQNTMSDQGMHFLRL